jgi:hypothetical protein
MQRIGARAAPKRPLLDEFGAMRWSHGGGETNGDAIGDRAVVGRPLVRLEP